MSLDFVLGPEVGGGGEDLGGWDEDRSGTRPEVEPSCQTSNKTAGAARVERRDCRFISCFLGEGGGDGRVQRGAPAVQKLDRRTREDQERQPDQEYR